MGQAGAQDQPCWQIKPVKWPASTLSGAFLRSTIPGARGHPDLCSLAHRRPQGPPGQLCQPLPPRSNSLSSLSASVAFQAHMYPEGKQERDHNLEWKPREGGIYLFTQHIRSVTVPTPLWRRALRLQAPQETDNNSFSRSRTELSKPWRDAPSAPTQTPQVATAISWPGLERLSGAG